MFVVNLVHLLALMMKEDEMIKSANGEEREEKKRSGDEERREKKMGSALFGCAFLIRASER